MNIIMVTGKSGVGKDYIVQKTMNLLDPNVRVVYSPQFTTRAPRTGEVDGREYAFMTNDDVVSRESEILWKTTYDKENEGSVHYGMMVPSIVEHDAIYLTMGQLKNAIQLKKNVHVNKCMCVDIICDDAVRLRRMIARELLFQSKDQCLPEVFSRYQRDQKMVESYAEDELQYIDFTIDNVTGYSASAVNQLINIIKEFQRGSGHS